MSEVKLNKRITILLPGAMAEKENRESLKYRKYRNKVGSMRLSALFLHKLQFRLWDGMDILDNE